MTRVTRRTFIRTAVVGGGAATVCVLAGPDSAASSPEDDRPLGNLFAGTVDHDTDGRTSVRLVVDDRIVNIIVPSTARVLLRRWSGSRRRQGGNRG